MLVCCLQIIAYVTTEIFAVKLYLGCLVHTPCKGFLHIPSIGTDCHHTSAIGDKVTAVHRGSCMKNQAAVCMVCTGNGYTFAIGSRIASADKHDAYCATLVKLYGPGR